MRRRKYIDRREPIVLTLHITEPNQLVIFPLEFAGVIDFGNGKIINSLNTSFNISTTYETIGEYVICIYSSAVYFNLATESNFDNFRLALVSIDSWGEETVSINNFKSYTNLVSIPENTGKVIMNNGVEAFCECSSLRSVPENIFMNTSETILSFEYAFYNCASLQFIPENLFAKHLSAAIFIYTFSGCTSLGSIPNNLFIHNTQITNFYRTFLGCNALEGITPIDEDGGKLWERAGKEGFPSFITSFDCFRDCMELEDYDSIPSGWK